MEMKVWREMGDFIAESILERSVKILFRKYVIFSLLKENLYCLYNN